ncbi:MAG: hypothetical protein GY796_35995 [Chloroflexi bacterium]|nr:hypothetical protein [Chloroflexota bacterium]
MEGVIKNGRVALSVWDNLPYPFHWLARFPLLAVSLSRGEIEESFQLAAALLVPPQQRLPDELTEALEKAINASTPRPHLEHALQVAREMGYL